MNMETEMLDRLITVKNQMERGMAMLFCIQEAAENTIYDVNTFATAIAGTYEYLDPVYTDLCQIVRSVSGRDKAAAD